MTIENIKPFICVIHHEPILSEDGTPIKDHIIKNLVELTDDEFKRYMEAQRELRQFENDVQLFQIVLWNLEEYIKAINSYNNAQRRREKYYPKKRYPILELNRCLVNILTSAKTYLQFTENNLKRKYGKNSKEYKNFKLSTANAFDNSFSYRFLYHLRNFAQHGGLPITDISFIAKIRKNEQDEETEYYAIELFVSRDSILQADFNWNSRVKQELENGPKRIDINAHIKEFAVCLGEINSKLISDEYVTLSESAKYIEKLTRKIEDADGEINIVEFKITTNVNGALETAIPKSIYKINTEFLNTILYGRLEDITSNVLIDWV